MHTKTRKSLSVFAFILALLGLCPAATYAQSCTPPPSGLVGWWPGNGNALDVASTNNGVVHGNVTFAAGKVGQAFSADGNGSAVLVGNPASLQLQNMTIEAWIKRGSATQVSVSPDGGLIFGYGNGGYTMALIDDGTPVFSQVDVSGIFGTTKITDTAFHHLAVTKVGGTVVFYVDGTASAPQTYNPTFQFNTSAAVGGRADNFDGSFLGLIDEVSVYNRALAASEIQAIFNAGSAGKCSGPTAPSITLQPASQTATVGNNASFAVLAAGSPSLIYQWQLNGTNLSGATNPVFNLTNIQPTNGGLYSVLVGNPFGSTNSSNALLTVNSTPICIPPAAGLVGWWQGNGNTTDAVTGSNGVVHGNVTFAAGKVGQAFSADGNGSAVLVGNPAGLQLQDFTIEAWIKRGSATQVSVSPDGGLIFGYGSAGYTLALIDNGTPVFSQVDISAVFGTQKITDTAFHHLAVTKSGSMVVFYVDGTASAPQTYNPTFQFNTSAAVGGRADNFDGSFLGLIDEVSVYNRALAASEIQAIVNAGSAGKCSGGVAPMITTQPTNQTVTVGGSAMFTVTATGTAPLNYEWQLNGTNVSGGTNSVLNLTNVQPINAGNYSVVVSNPFGSTNSSNALLTINPLGNCTPPPSGLVGWWQGNGTTTDVISGSNGVLQGNATFAAGEVGQAFSFDGNGDAVLVGNPASLQLQNMTIEAWIKRGSLTQASLTPGGGFILGYGSLGYVLALNDDGTPVLSQVDVSNIQGGQRITDTAFHHLAVTKNGGTVVFYVDGMASFAPAYNPIFQFNTAAAIGARGDNFDNSFLGLIDEVSVYNRALAASEIQAIFNAGSNGKCSGPTAPSITMQPASQTETIGNNASFSVVAAGSGPLGYQWRVNNSAIGGETNSSLSLANVQPGQSGNMYSVTVSNAAGTTNSIGALLTVNALTNCTPPPTGIVSWWPGNGNTLDVAGTNNGTLAGNAAFATGKVGQAFSFDGNGDAVVVGNPASLQLQNFTIEAWIKRGDPAHASLQPDDGGIIFSYGEGGYGVGVNDDGTPFLSLIGVSNVHGGQKITDTNFHHLAVTKNGSTVVFYVDGTATLTANYGPVFQFNTSAAIGAWGATFQASFLGLIDEVSVYNRALAASEIQAIYNASSAGKCSGTPSVCTPPSPGLVSWWQVENNANDTVGGNNGALLNGASFAAGEVGHALNLNGGAHVRIPDAPSLRFTNAMTLEVWVNPADTTRNQQIVSKWDAVGGLDQRSYGLAIYSDARAYIGVSSNGLASGSIALFCTNTVPANQWTHIAATYDGAAVKIYLNGVLDSSVAYSAGIFPGTDDMGIGGAVGGEPVGGVIQPFAGLIDEASVYNRALTASEIQAIFNAGSAGKCNDVSPMITSQPTNQTVPAGANVTFSVSASGTAPLSYQWHLNGTNLNGATNPVLNLVNVQPANGGNYSVVVTNNFGSATSSNALLTVTQAASVIQVVSVNASGGVAVVPINLIAIGKENALGFSINFDPSLLSFTGVTLGSSDAGGILLSNTTLIASGKLGLGVALPANTTFAAGTQQVVKISFTTKLVTDLTVTPISFGDQPTVRQVSDAHAVAIPATYVNGTVTIPFGFEGDVSPRPRGDGVVSITDWVQVGRFVVRLDIPSTPGEFQRADCAPRSTLGDGALTVADWVQAGRYAIGADPLTPAGGPTQHTIGFLPMKAGLTALNATANRTLTVVSADTQAGQACDVSIQLNSQGNENALGFNITFDPSVLSFTGASLGSGATGAALNLNDQQAASGTIGLALALPTGSSFDSQTQEVARLHFVVASSAAGNTVISFAGQPVTPEVVDAVATPVTTTYVAGKLAIVSQNGNPMLTVKQTDSGLALSWPASASGFNLESSDSLTSTNWNGVGLTSVTNATDITVTVPLSDGPAFYRLHHP